MAKNTTTAIGNVPSNLKSSIEWLEQLSLEASEKKMAYDEALKAVAVRFDYPTADLKAALKARDKGVTSVEVGKLQVKIEAMQLVAEQ